MSLALHMELEELRTLEEYRDVRGESAESACSSYSSSQVQIPQFQAAILAGQIWLEEY